MSSGHSTQIEISGRRLTMETGRVAKQADGAVVVRYGDTVVLATVVASKSAVEGQDFFPLAVDYRERAYAGGRIPGGYFKREGRPVEKEVLTSRLIDRPLRPLFPKGFRNEIQLIALVLSADQENDPDILAMNGASAAVCVAGLPFLGPFGAVRIGLVDGQLVVNPTGREREASTLDLIVAATEESVVMVEAGALEVSETVLVDAIALGHQECRGLVRIQRALADLAGKPRWAFDAPAHQDPALEAEVRRVAGDRVRQAITIAEKGARGHALGKLAQEVVTAVDPDGVRKAKVREYLDRVEKEEVRRMVLDRGVRIDGRKAWETREISAEVSFLPRTHGSALFTRGETQALVAATLGTSPTSRRWRRSRARPSSASCSTTTSRRSAWARSAVSGAPAGGRSATARWPSDRSSPSCPPRRTFPTRSGSSRTSSNRTARRRWRRFAGPRSRSWTPGCRSRRPSPGSPWGSSKTESDSRS